LSLDSKKLIKVINL